MEQTSRINEISILQNLHSFGHLQLLDIVDSLRAQGLSNFFPLPQLIVCGDQSSGKSSVLEAISGVPFPKKDNLCTRFATEVILRRDGSSPETKVCVSINPGHARSDLDCATLSKFKHTLSTIADLPELINLATDAMGLGSLATAFSSDVLRLEVTGPDMPQLTIVDLPGLIHSENRLQSAQDVELVAKLVQRYMEQERSIILAVISAKNDYANQVVLKKARAIDPLGVRTLGIVTKPDTLHPGSESEAAFLDLASNQDIHFKLGWHVVRNPDSNSANVDDGGRDRAEQEFFRNSNWRTLDQSCLGAAELRERLSHVLFDQIKRELPNLVKDIENGVLKYEADILRLGRSRTSEADQRLYLMEIGQRFSDICLAGCNGNYDDPFFEDVMLSENGPKRLRAVVQNDSIDFAAHMAKSGSKWRVQESADGTPGSLSRSDAIKRVMQLLKGSRGRELPGTVNPLLVGHLFKEYSSPWQSLARQHLYSIWQQAKTFIELIVQSLADKDVGDALFQHILDPNLDNILSVANERLEDFFEELKRHPITYNHYFLDTVSKMSNEQQESELRDSLDRVFTSRMTISRNDIEWLIVHLRKPIVPDMDYATAETTFNHMQAYYKVSMKRFIDHIPAQILETAIMTQLPGLLAPAKVPGLSKATVRAIAGESKAKQQLRAELEQKLAVLKGGESICKRYAARLGADGLDQLQFKFEEAIKVVSVGGSNDSRLGVEAISDLEPSESNPEEISRSAAHEYDFTTPQATEVDDWLAPATTSKASKKKKNKHWGGFE